MLTADYLDVLPDAMVELYERYQQSVINDIARRLVKSEKMTQAALYQVMRFSESGLVYENALEELTTLTGMSQEEMKKIFKDAGVKSIRFDDAIYRAAGLQPVPFSMSRPMLEALNVGLNKTNGLLYNLTLTTADAAQEAFIGALDLAYMQVSSGAFDYNTAIRNAVKDVAKAGIPVINYTGSRDRLDVAVRRAVLTGVSQTVGEMQINRADEMGADLVQTSAHVGARDRGEGPENHASWQGKVFSRSGTSKKYPSFVEETGYGTGEGLMGWNCRHSFFPFFEGLSQNAYDEATLRGYDNKTVTYNDKTMSFYEATQKQRAIERRIRQAKREANALEAAGMDNTAELAKVRNYQSVMRDFVAQTGLDRQSIREQV